MADLKKTQDYRKTKKFKAIRQSMLDSLEARGLDSD